MMLPSTLPIYEVGSLLGDQSQIFCDAPCLLFMRHGLHQHEIVAGIDESISESVKKTKNILNKHSPAPQNQIRHSAP